MLAGIEWSTATIVGLSIFTALCAVIGGVWVLASVLFRIESKVDVVSAHVSDHCDDIDEIKRDVKGLSRSAGTEVLAQAAERRRVQARDRS